MKTIHVGNNESNIDFIYHISDIHIRLYQRMKEYDYCFQALYQMIREDNRPNSIIVITGDIVHSKNELSPECDMMTFDFLQSLSMLKPTIVIAGNHDALLNNPNRTDTLSSILHQRVASNLYFLKHSGVYKFCNLYIYVDSCLDQDTVDMTQKIQQDGIHIALYHGGIVGWRNVKGYISDHGENYMENFRGMDYVLLGDIHMFQYMSTSNPVAAYSGSLISQNFGETDKEHGILEWDLTNKTQRLRPLENPYRFQDVYLLPDQQVRTDHVVSFWKDAEIAPYGQIKVYATTDDIYSRDLFQQLQSTWKKSSFHYQSKRQVLQDDAKEVNSTQDDVCHLLHDYVGSNVSPALRDDILSELTTEWTEHDRFQVAMQWNIRSIRFSNLFGYGPNNCIDFTRSSDKRTIGIFGENSVGKSTIIDIISLLLFDKVTRFSHGLTIPKEVIHFQESKASGQIQLQIGSEEYTIEKNYTRLKSEKIKLVSKFFQTTDGIRRELTGEQRKKTNAFIEQIIGRYDIFIYINSYLQQREQSFRDMSPSQKKKFLNELYGYHCFADMEKKHRELYKEVCIQYKTMEETYRKTNEKLLQQNEGVLEAELQTMEGELCRIRKLQEVTTLEKERLLMSLQFTEETFHQKETELEEERKMAMATFASQSKACQEAESFLSIWTDHFLLVQWEQLRDCPLYQKWKPSVSTTKQKWDTFYSDLICHDSTLLDSIRQKLCSLLKTLNNSEIHVKSSVLESFPLNNYVCLKAKYETLQQKRPELDSKLKQLYNQLQYDITLFEDDKYYTEMEIAFQKRRKDIQSQKEQVVLQKAVYDNYLRFLQNESGVCFLEKDFRYEKHSRLYVEYSPFHEGIKSKWEREFHRIRDFHYISVTDLRTALQKKSDALSLLELQLDIPRGKSFPSEKVRSCVKELKKKLFRCTNCALTWTTNDETNLTRLDQTEAKLHLLRSEIDMLQEMIHDITFQPNTNCNVCLQNKDYLLRLQRETKRKQKLSEWNEVSKHHEKLQHFFKKRFTTTGDVHFVDCLSNLTVTNIRRALVKKKDCIEKIQKQTELRSECKRILDEDEQHKLYTSRLRDFQNLKHEKEKVESHYHEICDFYSKKDVYHYLDVQWQWKDYLPPTMSELQQIVISYDQQYETLVTDYDRLSEDATQLEEEKKKFEKSWSTNKQMACEILKTEAELKELYSLETWLNEVEKHESLKQQQAQLQEIEKLQNMEEQCQLFFNHQKSIDVLCMVWNSPVLWNVNVDDISKKMETCKQIVKDSTDFTKCYQEKMTTLGKNHQCLIEQWDADQKNMKIIQEIEEKRQVLQDQNSNLEREVFEKNLLLRQLQNVKVDVQEQKTRLYDLQRTKEKESELCTILDKDGLPLYLLRNKMTQMESQMNELLAPFLPKKHVRFYIEQKNIEFGVVSDTEPDKMCNYFGGMESFIIELVVKLTFSKFSILPRSNFFIIDEGISVMDQQNISNISSLFQFLSNLVTNVLLISHIPQIQDFVDKSIHITKKDYKSHVEFLNL